MTRLLWILLGMLGLVLLGLLLWSLWQPLPDAPAASSARAIDTLRPPAYKPEPAPPPHLAEPQRPRQVVLPVKKDTALHRATADEPLVVAVDVDLRRPWPWQKPTLQVTTVDSMGQVMVQRFEPPDPARYRTIRIAGDSVAYRRRTCAGRILYRVGQAAPYILTAVAAGATARAIR